MAQRSLDKPKTQLLGNGCETAKHHLNPSAGTAENTKRHLNPSLGTAKNNSFGGSKTAPLEPPKKNSAGPKRHLLPQYVSQKHGAT